MIVDDRFAILGSANINDRSMLGERDSELAVMIMDEDVGRADISGKGSDQPIRIFAHELRTKIWKKLFGIGLGARAADLQKAIDEPGSPDSWRIIQKQAQENTELFEAAFSYIPRSFSGGEISKSYASIIPTWSKEVPAPSKAAWSKGNKLSPLPSEKEFWDGPQYNPAVKTLSKVKGFITALPLHWTRDENILIRYPTAIIVNNTDKRNVIDDDSSDVLVAENRGGDHDTKVDV
jgi:phospholipase D1/2